MSEPVTVPKPVTACPQCGDASLRVVHVPHFYVECKHGDCFWTQAPDPDLVIAAAVETARRVM